MAVIVIHLCVVILIAAVQMVVDLGRQVIQTIRLRRGGRVKVDEHSPAEAQRGGPLLQGAQHSFVGERRADGPGGEELVAAAAVVGQVTAVAAAEGADVTLVRFLTRVRAHVGFQVALVRRGKRAQLAAMRLLSWVTIGAGNNWSYKIHSSKRTLL